MVILVWPRSSGRWQMAWFSTSPLKRWKQSYTQTHLACGNTDQHIFSQPLRTSSYAKRMKQPWEDKTVQNGFNLPTSVVTKQGLGAASKPYHCLSIKAFIAVPHPNRVTLSFVVSCQNFWKYRMIDSHVQPCILFWGCFGFFVLVCFFVIGCWQIWYYSLSLLRVYTEPFPASWSFSTRWYSAQSIIETGHGCSWGRQTSAKKTGHDSLIYLIYK